jgi:hypothetical protein
MMKAIKSFGIFQEDDPFEDDSESSEKIAPPMIK